MSGEQDGVNDGNERPLRTRGLQSALRVCAETLALKRQKQWEDGEEGEGKANDTSTGKRGREIERVKERLSERQSKTGREWVCIAELRALQYIAVPSPRCVLCSPSGSRH